MANIGSKVYLTQVFESEQSFASTLLVMLVDDLESVDWFAWDPEALRSEILDRFNARIPQANMDKIQGLILALTTNQFYVSLEAFIGICNSLAGDGADFRTFDPADVEEMMWAVTEVLLNDHPHEDELSKVFSEEIKHYIGIQAASEGFKELPKPLTFGVIEGNYDEATEAFADAELFGAFYSRAKDEVAAAQADNQQKLQLMVQQVSRLPLRQGDSESWQKFSGRGLGLKHKTRPSAEAGRHRSASLTR